MSTRVYLESNVFIYAVEGLGETAAPTKRLIDRVRTGGHPALVTSELTLAEVLAPEKRADALSPEMKRDAYLGLLVESGLITLVEVSRSILIDTAELRSRTRLKLPDAIHLVSALAAGCRYFVSGDRDYAQMPEGIGLVRPDATGIAALLAQLT